MADFIENKLNDRRSQHSFRSLKLPGIKIDFCSNDYLGIAKNHLLKAGYANLSHGSGGSRLLAGNYSLIEETEQLIASFHEAEAALIYNSGYDANLGLLSCVPQRGDTVIYDHLSHASIRDGIRLSFAESFSFLHNDLNDLEKKLLQAKGNIFVVTESVFSMDGDMAPLQEMVAICKKFKAQLIVDEAHGTGVIGKRGEGLVQLLNLHNHCFARVHTFGKALGCHGAAIVGSQQLKEYLINFSRPFIFSTSLPELSIAAVQASYNLFPNMSKERGLLQYLISKFQSEPIAQEKLLSQTAIQVVVIPGNEAVKSVAGKLQDVGLDVRAILYPTVPKGGERLRIVLHAFNTEQELDKLIGVLKK